MIMMRIDRTRMFWPGLLSLASMAAVWALAPHLIGITLYKGALISAAAWGGYWLDRAIAPYARPHRYLQDIRTGRAAAPDMLGPGVPARDAAMIAALLAAVAQLRRAAIMVGAMIAAAMAV